MCPGSSGLVGVPGWGSWGGCRGMCRGGGQGMCQGVGVPGRGPRGGASAHMLTGLSGSWQPIMKFINDQYEKYLQEEVNINRKKRIPDTRVHCCLYFIPATGHSYVLARGRGGGALHAPRRPHRTPPPTLQLEARAGQDAPRPAFHAVGPPSAPAGSEAADPPSPRPWAPGYTLTHVLPSQPQAPGHRVHEAPKQSGQHRSGHRQGRHADPGGAGPLQTAGRAHSPGPRPRLGRSGAAEGPAGAACRGFIRQKRERERAVLPR